MKSYTLHVIGQKKLQVWQLLQTAADNRGVTLQQVNPMTLDFTIPPLLGSTDLLYRYESYAAATITEKFLMNSQVTTFYATPERAQWLPATSFIVHEKLQLPAPRTVTYLTRDRDTLRRAVEYVGGFPAIIKVMGRSHGVGVIKVESWSGLFSLIDSIYTPQSHIIMRQYISTTMSARLIVLGDKVIDSIEYMVTADDFRSNIGRTPQVQPKTYSDSWQQLAVQAVTALGIEYGGVDIISDSEGNPYITEVNFPCNFARAQLCTGTDIAGHMIDYLIAKANRT